MDSSTDTLSPFSATYRLAYHLESGTGGTRCGCIINEALLSSPLGVPKSVLESEILVTGGNNGDIMIWKLHMDGTVEMLNSFMGHDGTIMDVIGCRLVDAQAEPKDSASTDAPVTSSEASWTFYSCGRDRMIHKFNVAGQKIATFNGHEDVVCSLKELPAQTQLVSGSWDGTAIVWNVLTGSMEYRIGGSPYKYSVYCNVMPDGRIVTGMSNGDICFWKNGILEKTQRVHDGVIRAISVEGNTMLTCANDCSVRKYSGTMDLIYSVPVAHQNFVYDVRHSTQFPVFFTSSEDNTVGVWDGESGQLLQSLVFESSIWKVIETQHSGVVVIPLNGDISIWQLKPGIAPPCSLPQVLDLNKSHQNTAESSVAEGSFEMILFRKANAAKALEHLSSFNNGKPQTVALSEKDFKTITSVFNDATPTHSDFAFVFRLIQWPLAERVPVFDFLKVFFMSAFCSGLLKNRSGGFQIYNCVCESVEKSADSLALLTVSLQLLANMFYLTLPRTIVLNHCGTTLQAIKRGGEVCSKMVQQAHSACIHNLIIASGDRVQEWSAEVVASLQTALTTLSHSDSKETWIGGVVLRYCRSLETLLSLDNKSALLVRNSGLQTLMSDVAATAVPTEDRRTIDAALTHLGQLIN
ncbi:WD domain, G-beta repeat containing protein, putative [Babesia caballi]|uniref:WD domain, G-beta repeat containing protein, putative n=1 Tax=Babesia caballi TaxID=5871 RepID=A0AAV4LWW4_BABCB|nr:WD domain, G-beta repeat containing protein, putative [Babesia caballi]